MEAMGRVVGRWREDGGNLMRWKGVLCGVEGHGGDGRREKGEWRERRRRKGRGGQDARVCGEC